MEVLGRDRARRTIRAWEIAAAIDRWTADGLSPSSLRHRVSALRALWRVLDGKRAPCPAADVALPPVMSGPPRAIPWPTVVRILAAMPDDGFAAHGPRPPYSLTKVRLGVIATTGIPHATLMRLRPDDVSLSERWVRLPGRKKGRGAPGRVVPLSAAGVQAFEHFAAAQAWGRFSTSSMRACWLRTLARLGLPLTWRPYDLRHTHATMVVEASGSLHAAQLLLGHTSPAMTARYAAAAELAQLRRAVDALNRVQAGTPAGPGKNP